MHILLIVSVTLLVFASVRVSANSNNTIETPSSTLNETLTPTTIAANTASAWTVGVIAFVAVVAVTGSLIYCVNPTQND